jgi:hypothetical protein
MSLNIPPRGISPTRRTRARGKAAAARGLGRARAAAVKSEVRCESFRETDTNMEGKTMATAKSGMTGTSSQTGGDAETLNGLDTAESILKTVDESTKGTTGVSLMHILTFGSIGASIALYFAGKKSAAIFVGLWPPTFQALKSVVDKNAKQVR